jgi:hypothetical protein
MGQATGVFQSVHPLAMVMQVATPFPEHLTASSVHWLRQLVTQLPPEQTIQSGQV